MGGLFWNPDRRLGHPPARIDGASSTLPHPALPQPFTDAISLPKRRRYGVHETVIRFNQLYIIHPMKTAVICANLTDDEEVLAAASLLDVVEDFEVTANEVEALFGKRVAATATNNPEESALWRYHHGSL